MRKISFQTLDSLFSKLARALAHYTCERCAKKYPENSPGLHTSHFIGRANKATRYVLANVDIFCWGCHSWMETRKPTDYREWKIKKLGETKFEELIEASRLTKQWTEPEKQELRNNLSQAVMKKYDSQ
jgi:5-methylcytosine-specific restriction endonuclease McrA